MAIVTVGNIEIVVRTRDEHCPPHVHADCTPDRWEARYKFNFLDDEVTHWDTTPLHNAPTKATLDKVGASIYGSLAKIRKRWWQVMGTTCLENLYVNRVTVIENGKATVKLIFGNAGAKGVVQVMTAAYDPATQILTATLSDGTPHQQQL